MHRQIIAARLAVRRKQVSLIEDQLVAACERAAGHGQPGQCPPQDRRVWDGHMWDRYLREAAAREYELGPQLRRLHGEIALLERLLADPLRRSCRPCAPHRVMARMMQPARRL